MSATADRRPRGPFDGVLQIVRYNWSLYLAAIMAAAAVVVLDVVLHPSPVVAELLIAGAVVGVFWLAASLAVSYYVYDLSSLYRWQWIRDLLGSRPHRLVNVHAGLDETSEALRRLYPDSAITRPFPFNAYYREDQAPDVDDETYRLILDGLIDDKKPWTLDELYALPQETQITRHICVEGWSAIGKWTGTPLREFLRRVGADTRARYVWFRCAEGYSTSIDMATALHPQTQMTFSFDGEVLPRKYGFPMKVRIPTKLGFKNPKHVMEMAVTDKYLGGYWEDMGYNWFSGS